MRLCSDTVLRWNEGEKERKHEGEIERLNEGKEL